MTTVVIVTTGESGFALSRTYSYTPETNVEIWDWDGTLSDVGTAFVALSNTTVDPARYYANEMARLNPAIDFKLINISFSGAPVDYYLVGGYYDVVKDNVEAALTDLGASYVDRFAVWEGINNYATAPDTFFAKMNQFLAMFEAEDWFRAHTPVSIMGMPKNSLAGVTTLDGIDRALQALAARKRDTRSYINARVIPDAYWGYLSPTDGHVTGLGSVFAGEMLANAALFGVHRPVLSVALTSGLQASNMPLGPGEFNLAEVNNARVARGLTELTQSEADGLIADYIGRPGLDAGAALVYLLSQS